MAKSQTETSKATGECEKTMDTWDVIDEALWGFDADLDDQFPATVTVTVEVEPDGE